MWGQPFYPGVIAIVMTLSRGVAPSLLEETLLDLSIQISDLLVLRASMPPSLYILMKVCADMLGG